MTKRLVLHSDLLARLNNSTHDAAPILQTVFESLSNKVYSDSAAMLADIAHNTAMLSNYNHLIIWNVANEGKSIYLYLNTGYGFATTGICIQSFEDKYLASKHGGI